MFNKFVLKLETMEKFGYDPELLSVGSSRRVKAKCDCGEGVETSFRQISDTWTCKDCARKKGHRVLTKWSKDENFFGYKTLNSVYWAGFWAADGCIIPSRLSVNIALKRGDRGHLERFRDDCLYTGPIFDRKAKPARVGDIEKEISGMTICASSKWIADLSNNFNITPRKSLTLKHPDNLTRIEGLAFVAGVVDGDGCIYVSDNQRCVQLQIVGTKDMLLWISGVFGMIKGFDSRAKVRKTNSNIYKYTITSSNVFVVYDVLIKLSKDGNIPLMNRKWGKLKECRRPPKCFYG